MVKKIIGFFVVLLSLMSVWAHAEPGNPMPADQAFKTQLIRQKDELQLKIAIYPGHYLYKKKFSYSVDPKIVALKETLPKGDEKHDEYFGKQEVYNKDITIMYKGQKLPKKFTLEVGYQGCEENSICYLPIRQAFHVDGDGQFQPIPVRKRISPPQSVDVNKLIEKKIQSDSNTAKDSAKVADNSQKEGSKEPFSSNSSKQELTEASQQETANYQQKPFVWDEDGINSFFKNDSSKEVSTSKEKSDPILDEINRLKAQKVQTDTSAQDKTSDISNSQAKNSETNQALSHANATNATASVAHEEAKDISNSAFDFKTNSIWKVLIAFFVAGLGLSFTACMYPLIPIVSGIIVGNKERVTKTKAFWLTFVYVQGLALTYTLVGVLAGLTGSLLTVWLQKPAVVLGGAILIAILAFSMFGFFEIQMPQSIQNFFSKKSGQLKGGQWVSVFLMGLFSALLIGPCVAPPLAVALGYIGQTGDAFLGGLALYLMAFGTGVPLMLVGVLGASFLPRSGLWMELVKQFFGLLLLLAAVYIATAYLPLSVVIILYVCIFAVSAGYLLYKQKSFKSVARNVIMIIALIFIVIAIGFMYNALNNRKNVIFDFLNLPIGTEQSHIGLNSSNAKQQSSAHASNSVANGQSGGESSHIVVHTLAQLNQKIDEAFKENPHEPVFVDFYADWCVTCKEMAHKTLNQPEIQALINPKRYFLVDVTDGSADAQDVLQAYGLYGPPGFFLLKSPTERSKPVLGYVKASELKVWIEKQLSSK